METNSQTSSNESVELNQEAGNQLEQQAAPILKKLKINGEEKEFDLEDIKRHLNVSEWDENLEKILLPAFQKSYAADQIFNDVGRSKKEIELEKGRLKMLTDSLLERPGEVLDLLGIDQDKLAIARLQHILELEGMSPDQREAYDLKQKLQQEANSKKDLEEQVQQYKFEQETASHLNQISNDILDVIGKTGLPKTKDTIEQIAQIMLVSEAMTGQPVTAHEAAKVYNQRRLSDLDSVIQSLTPEQIGKLSADSRRKIQDFQVSQVKRKPGNNAPPPGTSPIGNRGDKQLTQREIEIQKMEQAFASAKANNFGY